MKSKIEDLEKNLNDFSPEVREAALAELNDLIQRQEIGLEPAAEIANMHCHTFFSYNGYGHSPTSLA